MSLRNNHLNSSSLLMMAFLVVGISLAACTKPQPESSVQIEEKAVAAEPSMDELASKGLKAVESFPGLANLCDMDMRFRNVNIPRTERPASGTSGQAPRAPRSSQTEAVPLPPMQVFDDLYFVGRNGVSAWLAGSDEDGYVLIDALTSNDDAEKHILGGIQALGVDATKIKRFVITHGHGDHFGGHRLLTAELGLPVEMSEPDWVLSNRLGEHPRFGPPPEKGLTVEDGDVISLGKTQIELFVAPAHTPGTLSPIITVHDNGVPHKAVLWGGTGLNFGADPRRMRQYAESAARLRDISRDKSVDIFLSNHPPRDGSDKRMQALANREAGAPHPFVMGNDVLEVFDVFEFCPLAQAMRIESGAYDSQG